MGAQCVEPRTGSGAQEYPWWRSRFIDPCRRAGEVNLIDHEGYGNSRRQLCEFGRPLFRIVTAGGNDPKEWAAELAQLPQGIPVTLVINKIDLTGAPAGVDEATAPPRVFLSARTGAGLDALRTHLKASAGYLDSESGALAARRRHLDALGRARQHVQTAADILRSTLAFELFAE